MLKIAKKKFFIKFVEKRGEMWGILSNFEPK